ncbi:MAG: UvrD-helicase domain-containing protein [Polyangiales bacterium]
MLTLDTLNAPQREAVLHGDGPLVVFAGAGSGKTRVITYRIARLVEERRVPPWRILAVTFTNKAAGEMRERLEQLAPGSAHDLWVGTFHATCARLLRRHGDVVGIRQDFTIYDDSDQRAMVTRVMRDLGLDEKRNPPKRVQWAIGQAKQEGKLPEDMLVKDPPSEIAQRVYTAYQERMTRAGTLDFDDLIFQLVRGFEREPSLLDAVAGRFDYVLVDEFQDTNRVQSMLVNALAAKHKNLCVVGDDDQSIYRWRGADRRNILDFRQHFPEARIIKLEQNYRSTQRILRAAYSVISRNLDREPKELWTENVEGAKVIAVRTEDEREEARMIATGVDELRLAGRSLADIAIFYRTHAQSRVLEEALRSRNMAYRVVGGMRFYERAEVKDILGYLRALHNPDDDVSLLRIINTPARGIGKTSIERLVGLAFERRSSLWDAVQSADAVLTGAALKKVAAFRALMGALRTELETATLPDLAHAILDKSGYLDALDAEDTPEADARKENLQELVGSIDEFAEEAEQPTLASFLELVTLDSTAAESTDEDRVTLMTVHAAKGLEFPVVFVAGLEEGVFPMKSSELWDDPDEMEEERRLAYVAFTRARERLVLSHASVRRIFGQLKIGQPSRFLAELPAEDVDFLGGGRSSAPPPRAVSHGPSWSPPPRRTEARVEHEGSYVDYGEGSDLSDEGLRQGMRVRHAKFGVGRVTAVGAGLPPRVSVDFPGWGTKQIVSTYLEPA